MRRVLPAIALSLTACGAPSFDSGSLSEPIVGGTTDPNDPAVVLVIAQSRNGESLCTGEVVSPHVVLTAAHCVDPATVGSGNTFQIFLGSDYNNATQANNAALFRSVQATHYDTAFNPNNLTGGHDVGVVITNQVLGPTPLVMNRRTLTRADVGTPLRIVGYGITSGNDTQGTTAGTKRQTNVSLTSVNTYTIGLGDARHDTCEGDSGGPAFMTVNGTEIIAGITSYGDQGCTQGGFDTRVDIYGPAFVDQYILAADGVVPSVPDLGVPVTPPVQDMAVAPRPDLGVAPGPVDMVMGTHTAPDLAYAGTTHPDLRMTPVTVDMASGGGGGGGGGNGGGGVATGTGSVGDYCRLNFDCRSGVCASVTASSGYCTQPCTASGANVCPDGYTCTSLPPSGQFCVMDGAGQRGDSGCNVGGHGRGTSTGSGFLLAVGAVLALIRRRILR